MNMNKYLVVDRALTVTRRVRRLLENEGVDPEQIHEAFTASEAMRLYREHRPDVVILEVDLPDMGGHEVAKDIWETDPATRVILHTGLPAQDHRVQETVNGGGAELLRKPLGGHDLTEVVQRVRDEMEGVSRVPPPRDSPVVAP